MEKSLKPPLNEKQFIVYMLFGILYSSLVFMAPYTDSSLRWSEALSLSFLVLLPVGYWSHKKHKKAYFSKLMPATPLLPPAPPAFITLQEHEQFKAQVEQELEKLREALERPKESSLEIQQIRDVLLQMFPEDWQALGEKSLAREMMLNEHQAALLIGLSVRTLQNRRSSGDTPYYHKIGQRAVYRLGDVLDFVKEHRCKPF